MNRPRRCPPAALRCQLGALALLLVGAAVYCLQADDCALLTADQRGYRDFRQQRFADASAEFADPMWRGVALYRQGEFEEAASLFAGFDTADGAFNQANALVMLGKYDAAVQRYDRALQLRPDWPEAETNRAIAAGRAEALAKQGGDMTGGMMGADDFTFEQGGSPPSSEQQEVETPLAGGDAQMRAVWLRQVQTRPADFLRSKFAYQYAVREAE
jgi:Ca-activated chloride channel family protein